MSKINLSQAKETYKLSEWQTRETEYVAAVAAIEIPDDIDTAKIKVLESDMDKIYTQAATDYGYVNRKFQSLERARKALEKELFLVIKAQQIQGLKTVDEITGAVYSILKIIPVADVIAQKPIDVQMIIYTLSTILGVAVPAHCTYTPPANPPQTLMQAIYLLESRVLFLQQIIDILKTKHGSIIILTGGLKLEAGLAPSGA